MKLLSESYNVKQEETRVHFLADLHNRHKCNTICLYFMIILIFKLQHLIAFMNNSFDFVFLLPKCHQSQEVMENILQIR